jgi:hypothetical protein
MHFFRAALLCSRRSTAGPASTLYPLPQQLSTEVMLQQVLLLLMQLNAPHIHLCYWKHDKHQLACRWLYRWHYPA